eukprot:SAG31_NODE_23178_length_509_cov_1.360976_1_plen_89_part_10
MSGVDRHGALLTSPRHRGWRSRVVVQANDGLHVHWHLVVADSVVHLKDGTFSISAVFLSIKVPYFSNSCTKTKNEKVASLTVSQSPTER